MITVSGLYVYPVKSCRGVPLAEAEVVERGFRGDREWMVVDADGRFLSQRGHPALARVGVALAADGLRLQSDGMPPLEVPIARSGSPTRRVLIWRDWCEAESSGSVADDWFSRLLGIRCQLVRMPAGTVRQVDPRCAGPADQVGFADAFPFLLLSEGSLGELNRRLTEPVAMDRFRPNIVVAGCDPHAEDGWAALGIGEVSFMVAKPCARCVITTTDQLTGTRSPEPLRTLASYRTVHGEVIFGQNLVHRGRGWIRVGDPCRVVRRAR